MDKVSPTFSLEPRNPLGSVISIADCDNLRFAFSPRGSLKQTFELLDIELFAYGMIRILDDFLSDEIRA